MRRVGVKLLRCVAGLLPAAVGSRLHADVEKDGIGPVFVLVVDTAFPVPRGGYPPNNAIVLRGTGAAFARAVLAPRRNYNIWYAAPRHSLMFLTTLTTGAPGVKSKLPLPENIIR